MAINATNLTGSIEIKKSYDIRYDSKLGKATDMEPEHCACCDRKIFKVALLVNGDILGAECACILGREWFRAEESMTAMRQGRTMNSKQVAYATSHGLMIAGVA